jgi:MurNAc alpha-1-phosphate uridylyltransferase
MVLAAGLGTRMRPLTNDRSKALVEVGGKALIDHMLDRLADAGVTRAIVNVHAFADRLEDHLLARTTAPRIVISDERVALLETGGGLKAARALIGDEPVWVANIDSVWIEEGKSALEALAVAWDPAAMDVLLLCVPLERAFGFDGSGDVFIEPDGCVRFRGDAPTAPYAYMGVHIANPAIVDGEAETAFSLTPVWKRLAQSGRVHAVIFDGDWMHVGDPGARDAAEARLT